MASSCLPASLASAQPSAREEALLAPASGGALRGGAAVAIDGSYVLVGVPGTGTATTRGTVYIYHRTAAATWELEQTLADPEPSSTNTGDMFGSSVALVGTTAIVGDPGHASMAGQAWIVTRGGGTPPWTASRVAPPGGAPTRFGLAVAIASRGASGSAIVIGAPDSGGGRAGAVFVFDDAGAMLGPVLTTPTAVAGSERFGAAVAVAADASTVSILVGAPEANTVYPATLSGTWMFGAPIRGPSTGKFGTSVALSTDGLVAAIGADEESSRGAAYGLVRTSLSTGWPDIGSAVALTATDTAASDHFGRSVAASPDAIVVGAPNHDDPTSDSGSVYLFRPDASGGGWHLASRYHASTGTMGDLLGSSVAVSGATVVGGAPKASATLGYAGVFPFPLEDGDACTLAERCGSGFCVDDVCCEGACGGGATDDCVACSIANGGTTDGACTAARETMSCTACGMSGTCGAGTCSTPAACDAGAVDVDSGVDAGGSTGGDGGVGMDGGTGPLHHVSGCKCEAGAAGGSPSVLALALAGSLVAVRRRRRRAKEAC